MLKGVYESEWNPGDMDDNNISFGRNISNLSGSLYSPILDESDIFGQYEMPTWPQNKEFAVCLTHDVDYVTKYSVTQAVRKGINRVLASESTRRKIHFSLKCFYDSVNSLMYSGQDPFHTYERWMEIEDRYGAKSTFFFMAGNTKNRHRTDHAYKLTDSVEFQGQPMSVQDMINILNDNGFEIGLHPTWYTYNDPDQLVNQKNKLEDVINEEVRSVRQHNLHYDIQQTPKAHSQAGFDFDSTIGFNNNVGFRYGTSHPWKLYDLEDETPLNVIEIPLIAQDVTLFRNRDLNLNKEIALEYMDMLSSRVKQVGGVFTLSWHPNTIENDLYVDTYIETLEMLSDKGAWFGTMSEIGDWVKKENRDSLERYTD